jgi:hypothetical protein
MKKILTQTLFAIGCAAGVTLAVIQYAQMFGHW